MPIISCLNLYSGVLIVFVFLGVLAVGFVPVCLGFRSLPGSAVGLLAPGVLPGSWFRLCSFSCCLGSRAAVSVLLGSLAGFI